MVTEALSLGGKNRVVMGVLARLRSRAGADRLQDCGIYGSARSCSSWTRTELAVVVPDLRIAVSCRLDGVPREGCRTLAAPGSTRALA